MNSKLFFNSVFQSLDYSKETKNAQKFIEILIQSVVFFLLQIGTAIRLYEKIECVKAPVQAR